MYMCFPMHGQRMKYHWIGSRENLQKPSETHGVSTKGRDVN